MVVKKDAAPSTITCQHCRYERPAKDKRCHICGYPWDFAADQKPVLKTKKKPRG